MEGVECKRTRKPVSYAEMADVTHDEDDFDDFKASSSSKKEKVKERKDKVDGKEQKDDRERKHHKDKHKDHKRHKDKDRPREDRDRHRRDRDKHREDRERHRDRHSRERDESKKREHKERRHRSERQDDKLSQDSGKEEGSIGSTCSSSDSHTLHDSPAISIATTASPLVSPSRRNPKPRLSMEEKIFQRELQTVLELSKAESSQASPSTPEPGHNEGTEEGVALDQKQETQSPSSSKSPQGHSAGDSSSPPTQDFTVGVEASPSTTDKVVATECVKEVVQMPEPSPPPLLPALPACMKTMEPIPSTSTGKTAKRIRKTVVFKEDSDSDDFDGFGYDMNAESDASEGSDFMPSPKKKRKSKESKKTKNNKPTKNNTQKSASKSTNQNKKDDVMSSPRGRSVLAKENTAPKNSATPPQTKSTVFSPKVSTTPDLRESSSLPTPPPPPPATKASTNNTSAAKPVKRPLISMPSSPSAGTPSIALVKTPFRSPLSTSPNSGHPLVSPAAAGGTKTLYRGTGLRLGLSRKANFKPLHPSVAGRPIN